MAVTHGQFEPRVDRTTVPDLPGSVVARPRLFRLLNDALAYPIVTVTGPAGWGKSQLLASWVRSPHCSLPAAWFTVERSDADPRLFWPAVMAAVSTVRERTTRAVERPVDSVAPVLEALLSVENPLLLILDDVHLVEGSPVEPEFARLVQMLPPRVRLILSGQYLPALPLAKLRVERKVFAIAGKELAFTTSESALMLAESGIEVSEQVAKVLRDRTEGWSAGLRLAALSLADGLPPEDLLDQFGGDHIDVADYLMSEVLSRLPRDVEEFLLRTSICGRLTGELAAELTGRRDSAELLKWMAKHNVFTTADGPRQTWFRYHQMLGELLRSRLDQLGVTAEQQLHLTASSWFSAHGMAAEAFDHAVHAERWASAATILMDAWLEMYVDGKLVQLAELIDRLPPDVIVGSQLVHVRTAVGLALGDASLSPGEGALTGAGFDSYISDPTSVQPVEAAAHESAEPIVFSEVLDVSQATSPSTPPELVVDLERARLGGDLVAAVTAAQRLIQLSGSGAIEHVRDPSDLRAVALLQLGVTEYWAGRRRDAEAHLREALSAAAGNGRAYLQLGCLGQIVLVLTAQNRLSEALRESEPAVALAREQGWEFTGAAARLWYALGWAAYVRGELDLAEKHLDGAAVAVRRQDAAVSATVLLVRGLITGLKGRKRDALALLDEAGRVMSRLRARYVFSDYIIGEQVRMRVAIGDIASAQKLLAPYRDDPAGPVHLSIARAELLIHQGRPDAAAQLLQQATRRGEGLVDQHVQALVLLALLQTQAGDEKRAIGTCGDAVALAAPEHFVQPFLQFGRPVERLLRQAARQPQIDRTFIDQVIEQAENLWSTADQPRTAPFAKALDQKLTDRELEVLRSLDSLASLPEISASLFVSVNTLKAHLRSLYRKLTVGSRREAVAKARSLGLM